MGSKYFSTDTIAATVTANNAVSALGVIRVSGPDSWKSVEPLLQKRSGKPFRLDSVESHKLYRCNLKTRDGSVLDDGMFVWMKGPRSFTGEDSIELHLHGSPLLLRRAMQELLFRGVREALPGEFSFRAFRNGKLTLDEAESVADLISSQSEESAKRALNHLLGRSRGEIASLKKELVDRLAEIEIDIDFSDQGLSSLRHEEWAQRLSAWNRKVEAMRAEYLASRPLREGIRLALVGQPNSGKSSLFNRLLGEDRSIVSREEGTTRDVIREALLVRGLLFRVSDTAGIRSTDNSIESEGIARSFGEVSTAHLVLWVFDGTKGPFSRAELEAQWSALARHLDPGSKVAALWNKADQKSTVDGDWLAFFSERQIPWVALSALTGQGVEILLDLVTSLYASGRDSQPDFLISRTRHFEVLGKAAEAVHAAVAKVERGEIYPDLLATDLRQALGYIGEITGEFTSDDLLNHIFAEFCIGK